MSADKDYNEELGNYLKGAMSHEEAQAFEEKALNDPFLQDAIEGAEELGAGGFAKDVEVLNTSIKGVTSVKGFSIWRIAATVSLLIVGGFSVWLLIGDEDQMQLAQETQMDTVEVRTEITRVDEIADENEELETDVATIEPKIKDAKPSQVASSGVGMASKQANEIISADDFEDVGLMEIDADDIFSDEALVADVPTSEPFVKDDLSISEDLDVASRVAALPKGGSFDEVVDQEKREANSPKAKKATANRSRHFLRQKSISQSTGKADANQITGKVTDNSGSGLPGVHIPAKGTTDGVTTNLDGEYAITVEEDSELKFSSAGLGTQEINVGGKDQEDVEMDLDATALEEVVVTAPGMTKEISSLGYSVSRISNEVTGTVTDEDGSGLAGVSVIVKESANGVTTGPGGNFSITASENDALVFNFIGMIPLEVSIGARSTLDVQMTSDDQVLQEVVVSGHGAFDNQEKGFVEAAPVTGWTDFRTYLEEELFYPEEAIGSGVEGRVVLQLTISRLGKITKIEVKKSLGEGCNEEAIRLINAGPKWKAASQDGHSVETKLRVKVKFELEE